MLPIVTQPPKSGPNEWGVHGTAADLVAVAVAVAAERAGYTHLCAPEHVALPLTREETRGSVYWCPFSTLGLIAGATESVALVTYVLVLGYHHPLEIAKRVGTLDRISGGRAVLGVGVGSLVEEFALLNVPFGDRGPRADDMMAALRAAMGVRAPTYSGEYVEFSGMIVDPGLRAGTEVWVGGRSRRSLRRAIEFADAWSPFSLNVAETAAMLTEPRTMDALAHRDQPLRVFLYPAVEQIDPIGDPDGVTRQLEAMGAAGLSGFIPHFVHSSRAHFIEQTEALAALAAHLEA
jgi:probable F420-dependent oxidoreductase